MKKSEAPATISHSKGNLGSALARLMTLRNYRNADVSREAGITKSIISEVLSGSRTAGPRTMAQLFRAFPVPTDRRTLLVAFLADSLADVGRHLSLPEKGPLLAEGTLGKIVNQSGVGEIKPTQYRGGPRWLDELMEEAIELGESEDHVVQLIRSKFEDYLAAKRAEKQSSK